MGLVRDRLSFGKRQEYATFGELLRRNFDVYVTLVDDQQIDCVVRFDGEPPRYVDVQIKARSNSAKEPGTFIVPIRRPRDHFYFIFYSEAANTYWVMPSLDLVKKAHRYWFGPHAGEYRIDFTYTRPSGEVQPLRRWDTYRDQFALLRGGMPDGEINRSAADPYPGPQLSA
jgi:hypothetical protein